MAKMRKSTLEFLSFIDPGNRSYRAYLESDADHDDSVQG